MSDSTLAYAPIDTVLTRVASELGAAACDLAGLEVRVAAIVGDSDDAIADLERLQDIDAIGQKLRAIETFLLAAAPRTFGLTDLGGALDHVLLEGVRARLAGGEAPVAHGDDAELW